MSGPHAEERTTHRRPVTGSRLSFGVMSGWSVEQVLALAPDTSSQRAAQGLAVPRSWQDTGHDQAGGVVWGSCRGSGSRPYQTCVDLAGPAYRCSCPSRKFPCKHALALLLVWAGGGLAAGDPPDWVRQWQADRQERQARQEAARQTRPAAARSGPSEQAVRRRAERVGAGLEELERWLADQVRGGLAAAGQAGYGHWGAMAARLVDAQAPSAASAVRQLAGVAGDPGRLLAELGLLWLLVAGYRRVDTLPADLAATVRARVGFPVATEQVLAGPAVRDRWQVVGVREEVVDDNLTARRTWLRGDESGRPALVLAFAAAGQALPADLPPPGAAVDADVHFYPGAQPLRALVGKQYGFAEPGPPNGAGSVAACLDEYATALARDPWLDRWPVLLAAVPVLHDGRWHLRDRHGEALPLEPAAPAPWPLVAGAGGRPVPVAAEWSPAGLRPLAAWIDDRLVRLWS